MTTGVRDDLADDTPDGVVVTGCHRSGTSLVARIMAALGRDPGPPGDLRAADRFNPDGYLERLAVVAWSDACLRAAGGWASGPPDADAVDALGRTTVAPTLEQALAALGHRSWFVKDPRLALLLGPWFRQRPDRDDLVVAVVRRPADVARSLGHRSGYRPALGLGLWERYNRAMATDLAGRRSVVVPYEGLVERPGRWCRILAAAVGLDPTSDARPEAAASLVTSGPSRSPAGRSSSIEAPPALDDLYRQLVEASGAHARFPAVPVGPMTAESAAALAAQRRRLRVVEPLRRAPRVRTFLDQLPGTIRTVGRR